jgi:hypothetical protein
MNHPHKAYPTSASLFALALLAVRLCAFSAAGAPGSVDFKNAELSQVLEIYQSMSGMELIIDPSVKALPRPINLKTDAATREEGLKLIEKALNEQAAVVITPLSAKRASVTCTNVIPKRPPSGQMPAAIDISGVTTEAELEPHVGKFVLFKGRYQPTKVLTISNGKVSIEVERKGSVQMEKDTVVIGVLKKIAVAPSSAQNPPVQPAAPGTHFSINASEMGKSRAIPAGR